MEFVNYILVEPERNLQEDGMIQWNPVNSHACNQTGTIRRMHVFSDLNI